jgi:hypothetical protein
MPAALPKTRQRRLEEQWENFEKKGHPGYAPQNSRSPGPGWMSFGPGSWAPPSSSPPGYPDPNAPGPASPPQVAEARVNSQGSFHSMNGVANAAPRNRGAANKPETAYNASKGGRSRRHRKTRKTRKHKSRRH